MSSYQQFVKKEMHEMKGSGVPPRERMAEVARRWRAQKGRASAMAPNPKQKRSPVAKKPRRRITAMAGAGSGRAAMSGGGMAALGPATQDLEGAGFLDSIGTIAETALKVAPLAMMVL